MNNYWHMMEQVTLSDRKKEEIMEMLENKNTRKRRTPSVKVMVLAAALAVGCVLSIAAGLPAQVYNFMSGGTVVVTPGEGGSINMTVGDEVKAPIVLENGRLWFVADGQKLDVTDKVDENTPYIYEHTDPDTKQKGYMVVGGTPENFGWVEIIEMDGGSAMSGDNFDTVSLAELYEAQENPQGPHGDKLQMVDYGYHRPWLKAALDQLGLDL